MIFSKKTNSQGIPCLLLTESGINGSTERIFKGFTRFLGYLILLDFGEKGVYSPRTHF